MINTQAARDNVIMVYADNKLTIKVSNSDLEQRVVLLFLQKVYWICSSASMQRSRVACEQRWHVEGDFLLKTNKLSS